MSIVAIFIFIDYMHTFNEHLQIFILFFHIRFVLMKFTKM